MYIDFLGKEILTLEHMNMFKHNKVLLNMNLNMDIFKSKSLSVHDDIMK